MPDESILETLSGGPAIVAFVVDPTKVVINWGSERVKLGERFQVYRLSEEEIRDPVTGKSLGWLEIVLGTGRAKYVQDKMSIIESDQTRLVGRGTSLMDMESEILPFDHPKVGDKAKPI